MTADAPVVQTTTGRLRGRRTGALLRFAGVPYAEPPVDGRRFQPPAPVEPWSGVREADAFGPASLQVFDPAEGELEEFLSPGERFDPAVGAVGSEDSLTLNVWTPALEGEPRPVLVYLHGGANWLEASRLAIYHGDRLAERGDVVVASLNYRLGVFGFLDLSPLGPDAPVGAGAHGLQDQRLALEWISANAAAFGGDPGNITLIGESAGAMDISWHIASGALAGRVRRVVMMSGVAGVAGVGWDGERSVHAAQEGARRAAAFLRAMEIDRWAALRDAPGEALIARQAALAARSDILFDLDTLFYPRVGSGAAQDPFQAAAAGKGADLDLLIGFTHDEMGLWLNWDDDLDRRSVAAYAPRVPFLPPTAQGEAAALYARACPDESEGRAGMRFLGDAMFVMPSLWFAELQRRWTPRVWVYDFDWRHADPRRGALHAADQAFFFGQTDTPSGRMLLGQPADAPEAQRRAALSLAMQDALIAFARNGDPNAPALPAWPCYGPERALMRFAAPDCAVETDPYAERRAWWFETAYPSP